MSGPSRAGLFIYASDLPRLATFYRQLLGLQLLHQTEELAVLQGDGLQLIVQQMPEPYASQVVVEQPPRPRTQTALKFFFAVDSLEQAEHQAQALGGEVQPEQWQGPGFVVRNACDPEGNLFHLRQFG